MAESRRVLLIEDDPDLRILIEMSLTHLAGWEVRSAASGSEGLALARTWPAQVALVDLMMPDMDGREVCRRLKADPSTAGIPVVFLTARAEFDAPQAEAAGAAGVIVKPFDPARLAHRIREVVGG